MLIALILFGLFGLAVIVVLVYVGIFKIGSDQKKAEASAPETLDALFDGRPDVTFKGHMRSMKFETVMAGAKKRGYRLAHQGGDTNGAFTLIFEKV